MAKAFPEIIDAIAPWPDAVLDGELVVPNSAGRSDFGLESSRRCSHATYPRLLELFKSCNRNIILENCWNIAGSRLVSRKQLRN